MNRHRLSSNAFRGIHGCSPSRSERFWARRPHRRTRPCLGSTGMAARAASRWSSDVERAAGCLTGRDRRGVAGIPRARTADGAGASASEATGQARPRGDRRVRKHGRTDAAGHQRAAVRRTARVVLVESSLRVRWGKGTGRAACRKLREGSDQAARAGALRRHGARVRAASGDARLSR